MWADAPAVASTPGEPALSADVLKDAAGHLAFSVGPIAPILVEKTALESSSVADLYQRLAQVIPNEAERQSFLDKAPRA